MRGFKEARGSGHVGGKGVCTLQRVNFGRAVTRWAGSRERLWVQILGGGPPKGVHGSNRLRPSQGSYDDNGSRTILPHNVLPDAHLRDAS